MSAVIEEVTKGAGKIFKKKSILVFAALGAVAGGVGLLLNKNKSVSAAEETGSLYPIYETGSGSSDNASVISDSLQSILDSYNTANAAQLNSIVTELQDQIDSTNKSIQENLNSIVNQVQQVQQVTQQPVQPVNNPNAFKPAADGYTSQPNRGFSDFSINVANGSPLDNSGDNSGTNNFRIDNSAFNNATSYDAALASKGSLSTSIVEHNGQTYNIDNDTGAVYKSW